MFYLSFLIHTQKECRVYLGKSRLSELGTTSSPDRVTDGNFYKFVPLEYHTCTRDALERVMSSDPAADPVFPGSVKVDGLLFYHKDAAYTSGVTPLATWLKVSVHASVKISASVD
jgi:hypothetical protein